MPESTGSDQAADLGSHCPHTPARGEGPATAGGRIIVGVDGSKTADLLVVGSRGHDGFTGMLLGSCSTHVAAHAHCPVVVRHRTD